MANLDVSNIPCSIAIRNIGSFDRHVIIPYNNQSFIVEPNNVVSVRCFTSFEVLSYIAQTDKTLIIDLEGPDPIGINHLVLNTDSGYLVIDSDTGNFIIGA